jgi:hypothetical protein
MAYGPRLMAAKQWTFVAKNAAAVGFTLPVHYVFNRFLLDGKSVSDLTLLCLAPLNVPPLLLADVTSTQWLAGVALAEAGVQYVMARSVRMAGLKYI